MDIRSKICKIISQMLDHPDEHGIYPTTKCYDELETLIIEERRKSYMDGLGDGKNR